MPNYYNEELHIITFDEYFKNVMAYQYLATIEVSDKDYSNTIKKDIHKDFYCEMIDNNVELKWTKNFSDQLVDYNSPFDYLILDSKNLESFMKFYNVFTWILIDFVNYLDMEENEKFDFLNNIIRVVNFDYIIKFKRVARNIDSYPIDIEELKDIFFLFEEYKYNDLKI